MAAGARTRAGACSGRAGGGRRVCEGSRRWGMEVRGAAASANYEDIALPATISSILH